MSIDRILHRRTFKLMLIDTGALAISLWLAYAIRFEFQIPADQWAAIPGVMLWVILAKLIVLYGFRQFHILPDFFSIPDLRRLAFSVAYASLVVGLVRWEAMAPYIPPRGVVLIDFLLSFLGLASIRLALRLRRERMRVLPLAKSKTVRRVGIIGAGEAGAILARELRVKRGLGLEPVAFFDDDTRKWDAKVYSIPVVGRPEVLLTKTFNELRLDEVVISMPSAPPERIRQVVDLLHQVKLKCRTVPSLTELALGKIQVSKLRAVEVEDLLGRSPVQLENNAIHELIANHCVLVTGAGGSIGSELCRQIAGFSPAQLLLVERSEAAMFTIQHELLRWEDHPPIQSLVVDILDRPRMRRIFEQYRPRLVFHAAAHKHVPMMESQPAEAIRNNTLGTAYLADLSMEMGVDRFVLISTDKAINPTSVMGTTKRLAEIYVQSLHASNPAMTRFMAVRFGNVLGSSGSVIPIFKEQIAAGGPVTVTHPDMTRYFMTIPEAVGLVLQTATIGSGGEIFMLDMGQPVKIVDLARNLIELSGLEPDKDIKIEFVGCRPGEKMFEELSLARESHMPTSHPKILRLCAEPSPLASVQKILRRMTEMLYQLSPDDAKSLLKEAVPEYQYAKVPGEDVTQRQV